MSGLRDAGAVLLRAEGMRRASAAQGVTSGCTRQRFLRMLIMLFCMYCMWAGQGHKHNVAGLSAGFSSWRTISAAQRPRRRPPRRSAALQVGRLHPFQSLVPIRVCTVCHGAQPARAICLMTSKTCLLMQRRACGLQPGRTSSLSRQPGSSHAAVTYCVTYPRLPQPRSEPVLCRAQVCLHPRRGEPLTLGFRPLPRPPPLQPPKPPAKQTGRAVRYRIWQRSRPQQPPRPPARPSARAEQVGRFRRTRQSTVQAWPAAMRPPPWHWRPSAESQAR